MKKAFIILCLFFVSFSAFCKDYTVTEVQGTVIKLDEGIWVPLKLGDIVTSTDRIKVSLNSKMVINTGSFKFAIPAATNGTVGEILNKKMHKTVKRSNIPEGSIKSKKAVITAASRASDAKDDICWDED